MAKRVLWRLQRHHRARDGVRGWRVVLLEAEMTDRDRQCCDIDRPGHAQRVHTRGDREGPAIRPRSLWIARRHRLDGERWANIREREGHRPGAADRAGHDLVGAGRLERNPNLDGIRIDLETPN